MSINKIMRLLILIGMTLSCSALVVTLRDGKKVEGEVVSKDKNKIVLKTTTGEKIVKWREMKFSCFKEINPELYEELKQKAADRKNKKNNEMLAKGLVKVGKKWLPKAEALKLKYKWIRLKVNVNEIKPSFKTYQKSKVNTRKYRSRECSLCAKIKLNSLIKTNNYELTVNLKNHLKYRTINGCDSNRTDEQETSENFTINNSSEYEVSIKTDEYKQMLSTSQYAKDYIDGYESDGYSIEILLDGNLVYKDKTAAKPVFNLVSKM